MSAPAPTIAALLADAKLRAPPALLRLDAELLLGHVLGRPRTWLRAHDETALENAQVTAWQALVRRRRDGEPLAYLVGEKEFHGLRLFVDGRVLVPRPETELLVECGLEMLALRSKAAPRDAGSLLVRADRTPRVVDLGTGSGAIALALKSAQPAALVHASDRSAGALEVARANSDRLGLEVDWRLGSWWEPWTSMQFDLALSNPPYIAAGDPHLQALHHEPAAALVSGTDGLEALRALIADAPAHLSRGGALWVEHGHDQAAAVQTLFLEAGFTGIASRRDLAGIERCTGGCVEG
jgi:release factor glutamine methyltransferase